jgi:hypothetical protein
LEIEILISSSNIGSCSYGFFISFLIDAIAIIVSIIQYTTSDVIRDAIIFYDRLLLNRTLTLLLFYLNCSASVTGGCVCPPTLFKIKTTTKFNLNKTKGFVQIVRRTVNYISNLYFEQTFTTFTNWIISFKNIKTAF